MAARVSLFLLALVCTSCGPNVESEHQQLVAILDADTRELALQVRRADDEPPVECTTLVGWVNTGTFRRARRQEVALPTPEAAETAARRLADRWTMRGFVVQHVNRSTESESVQVVTARES